MNEGLAGKSLQNLTDGTLVVAGGSIRQTWNGCPLAWKFCHPFANAKIVQAKLVPLVFV